MNCTKNLPCPTPTWCAAGCYFNDATLTTRNGGNTITDGQPLGKPVYTGDDLIDPVTNWFAVGLFACGLLWVAAVLVMAYGVMS